MNKLIFFLMTGFILQIQAISPPLNLRIPQYVNYIVKWVIKPESTEYYYVYYGDKPHVYNGYKSGRADCKRFDAKHSNNVLLLDSSGGASLFEIGKTYYFSLDARTPDGKVMSGPGGETPSTAH